MSQETLILYTLLNIFNKRGKKVISEKVLRKTLYSLAKKRKNEDIHTLLKQFYINTEPLVNFKKKKNQYKPTHISVHKKNFLIGYWLIKELNKKSSLKFDEKLTLEFLNIIDKKSNVIKKRDEFHKEALQKLNIYIKE